LDNSDSGASTNLRTSSSQSEQLSGEEVLSSQRANPTLSAHPLEAGAGAGLPAGWSMQLAPNGRIFFIDHNDKKTSWVDPRTGRASPMPNAAGNSQIETRQPEDELGSLPEGWEERVHSDGRIFFIDHSKFDTGSNLLKKPEKLLLVFIDTRITQWEDPRLSNPQIAGQAVPYSRDYKQKYEYLKSQLRKPVSNPLFKSIE
jgi:E3 ubiquitin-protein ligase NEDD4